MQANSTLDEGVPLADAAMALGLSWHAAYRLLLVGTLRGRRVGRNWFVTRESIRDAQGDAGRRSEGGA